MPFFLAITGVATGLLLLGKDMYSTRLEQGYYLERPGVGEGTVEEDLKVQIDGQWLRLQVPVEERALSKEEKQERLTLLATDLESMILGGNPSLDEVRASLNLVQKVDGLPVVISWTAKDGAVNSDGSLNQEGLGPDGMIEELTARLEWEDTAIQSSIYVHIYPPYVTEEEHLLQVIQEAVKESGENSRTKMQQELPTDADGMALIWKRPQDWRGLLVILIGITGAALQVGARKREEDQKESARRTQMEMDYPEVVSKLKLYMEAGLPCRAAWMKIAEDYQGKQKKGQRKSRYIYEEMVRTGYEMQSGVSEMQAYERFADRCQVPCYKKMTGLLMQNLRKGSRGLSDLLEAEMWQAFELRKALAKRQGEEAGTKLLIPMIGMMAVVVVIVIAPALMSMQM